MTVYKDPEGYLRDGASSKHLYQRETAREVCKLLAVGGYQLVGLEGFIIHDDGTHQPVTETNFTRNFTAATREDAEVINSQGIASIDEDPVRVDAYAIVARRFSNKS
ncbi:hypothetical protein [Mesorhizobium sp. IMUNJ 23232]|uniref:hypothetical protein n=1 Tax=Mesorhizobium sp. IMUNJ 23232 TaxID=3376064 RepID=UPI00379CCA77